MSPVVARVVPPWWRGWSSGRTLPGMAVENAPGLSVPADGLPGSSEPTPSVPRSVADGDAQPRADGDGQARQARPRTAQWGQLLITGFVVGAVAAAGQLGLGYGLGLLRLARVFPNDGLWSSQLTWVAWFALGAVLAGSAGARLVAGRHRLLVRLGGRIAIGFTAGLGAAVMIPLTAIPARFAQLPPRPGGVATTTPVLEVSLVAGLGVLAGIVVAVAALSVRLVAVSVTLMAGLTWLLALISFAPSLAPGSPPPLVRLAVPDLPADGAPPAWAVLSPPILALLVCGAIALAARSRGLPPLQTAAATASAPGLLALAYLIGSPGVGERTLQTSPYAGALLSMAAGLLVALLIGVVRPPAARSGSGIGPNVDTSTTDAPTVELPALPSTPTESATAGAPPKEHAPTEETPAPDQPGSETPATAPPESPVAIPPESSAAVPLASPVAAPAPAESATAPEAPEPTYEAPPPLTPAPPSRQPRWLATPLAAAVSRFGRRKRRRSEPTAPTPTPAAAPTSDAPTTPSEEPAAPVGLTPAAPAPVDAARSEPTSLDPISIDPPPPSAEPRRLEPRTLDLDALNLEDYLPRARAFTRSADSDPPSLADPAPSTDPSPSATTDARFTVDPVDRSAPTPATEADPSPTWSTGELFGRELFAPEPSATESAAHPLPAPESFPPESSGGEPSPDAPTQADSPDLPTAAPDASDEGSSGRGTSRRRKSSTSPSLRKSRSTKGTSRRRSREPAAADTSTPPATDESPTAATEPEDEHISWISSLAAPPEPEPRPDDDFTERVRRRLRRDLD